MQFTSVELCVLKRTPIAIFMLITGSRSANEKNAYILTWRYQVNADQYGPISADPQYAQVWQELFQTTLTDYMAMAHMQDESLWNIVTRAGCILRDRDARCATDDVENIARSFITLAKAIAYAPKLTLRGTACGDGLSAEESTIIQGIVQRIHIGRCVG